MQNCRNRRLQPDINLPKAGAQEEENWTPGDMTQAAGLPAAMHLALSQFNTTMLYDAMA